ncbi:MAG TPA: hypothetical protein VF143_09235 [Candidatus Nanopelagicales bacterium]
MRWYWIVTIVVVAATFTAITGFVIGWGRSPHALTVQEVTASRLATAMAQRTYFGEYRDDILLVSGEVAEAVGRSEVRFATPGWGVVLCQLAPGSPQLTAGQRIEAITVGAQARRVRDDLLLRACTVVAVED